MNVDLKDFREHQKERATERATAHRPQIEMLAQAAVKAEMLTGDPAWDQFLSFLQAAREKLKAVADNGMARLRNPMVSDPIRIAAIRGAVMQADAQIELLDAVIALPAQIKKGGDQAKDLLSRLAGNSTETEPTA